MKKGIKVNPWKDGSEVISDTWWQADGYGHRIWALHSHHVWRDISLSLPSREEIEVRYSKGLNPKPSLFIPNGGFMALTPSSLPLS